MSPWKPTREQALFDEAAIEDAVALLADAARMDFASVEAKLTAAGFGITGYQPIHATRDLDASVASDFGEVIPGRGIYHGPWQPRANGVIVHTYSDTDFLKDASGKQLLLIWHQTRDELARRNGGRRYGDGTETALADALAKPHGAKDAYQDGDLVMAPQVLLNGRDQDGKKVRAQNTFDLLSQSKGNAFSKISETLKNAWLYPARRSWSSSKGRDYPYNMRAVLLADGDGGNYEVDDRMGVLPFRVFREPHAVKAISHLDI